MNPFKMAAKFAQGVLVLSKSVLFEALAPDFLEVVDLGPEDLHEVLPLPDTGLETFRWVLNVDGMREVIRLAHAEPDPEVVLTTIFANTNFLDESH